MSGVRFNEERNKQDKTGLFILNSRKNMHNRTHIEDTGSGGKFLKQI